MKKKVMTLANGEEADMLTFVLGIRGNRHADRSAGRGRNRRVEMIGLLMLAAATAQESPQTPTFRTGVTLVRLSVVVKDSRGKAVGNLRREDFQMFDNGWPQDIRLFVSEKSKRVQTELKTPNTFSNQTTSSGASRSGYSVILIDSLFTDWGDVRHPGAANARISALRALRELPAGEKVAIYATTRKLEVICEFTSDRDLLERQLGRWKPSVDTIETSQAIFGSPSSEVLATSHAALAPQEDPAVSAAHIDAAERTSASNDGMDLAADHLATIPGRKNLIWLSNRFVIGPPEIGKFRDAGVAIYPVNIDGVTGNLDPLNQMLKNIAAQTGGVAYDMRNDIDIAIREAVEDGSVGYLLGYYQSDDAGGSTVHRLDVHVSRPGLTVRTYRADAPPPVSAADLIQALNRAVDATEVPVKASATRVQDSLNLKAVVDVGSLRLASIQDRWKGKLQIVARFMAADGKPIGDTISQTLDLNLRAVQQGLGYRNNLKIPGKAVQLKLLFANLASGKIGTLTIPLSEIAASEATQK
jgi:VWFA-related protein